MLKLHFTTITPLHISNGEQLGYGLDYILKDNYIYKLNPVKVAGVFLKNKIFNFLEYDSLNKIIELINSRLDDIGIEQSFYRVKCTNSFIEYAEKETKRGRKFIKEFINSNGNFYIPASSIKGALLTVFNKDIYKYSKEIDGEKREIVVKQEHFGIKEIKVEGNVIAEAAIKDKFVLADSDFIDSSNFSVFIFDRPPTQNLICLNTNASFSMIIKKVGNLDLKLLRDQLKKYSSEQVKKANKFIQLFENSKGKETEGSRYFKEALKNLNNELNRLSVDEYLINIGFGGGTYFKVHSDLIKIPKNRKNKFIHTSYTEITGDIRNHIGWCKLKIEEE